MADIGDVIELIEDMPKRGLRAGMRGTVVHQHTPDDYEVEFADEEGDTIDVLALRMDQFIIVWRAKTGQWVSVSKQVSDMIERLPNDAALEVLDFTRYVSVRSRGPVKPDMPA